MAELLLMEPNLMTGMHLQKVLSFGEIRCTLCATIEQALKLLEDKCGKLMTVLNTKLSWAQSAPFLNALQRRGLPVLFLTSDLRNEAHLKAMYQAECAVLPENCSDEELVRGVSHLLSTTPSTLTLGSMTLDPVHCQVIHEGHDMTLTRQESALLQALMESQGRTVTREELLRNAWGYQSMGTTRTVDVHVQRLRRKLGQETIETVYKLGYRLKVA